MTIVLVANIVLSALAFAAILGVAAWAIRGSHHEGRPITVASRRRWVRPTISLGRAAPSRKLARPYAS